MLGHPKCPAPLGFQHTEIARIRTCLRLFATIAGHWVLNSASSLPFAIVPLISTHQAIVYNIVSRMPGASPGSWSEQNTLH